MNRRTVIKQMAFAGAAAMLLPSCLKDEKKVSIALTSLKVTGDDEDLLASIAETLIPGTDKPGAKQVGAHLFTFVMVDDCLAENEKEKFMAGLRSFNKTGSVKGNTFMESTPEQRLETLSSINSNVSSLSESEQVFYKTARHYIIEGYTSSQYFLTEVKPFHLIPGPVFKGCVPVSDNIKTL
jgi:hypothetical protein